MGGIKEAGRHLEEENSRLLQELKSREERLAEINKSLQDFQEYQSQAEKLESKVMEMSLELSSKAELILSFESKADLMFNDQWETMLGFLWKIESTIVNQAQRIDDILALNQRVMKQVTRTTTTINRLRGVEAVNH